MLINKKRSVGIVIPIYNEDQIVDELFLRLTKIIDILPYDFTIIAVDDGSTDQTLDLLRNIQSREKRLKIIKLSRNWGHQNAFSAGLDFADADAVILMDGDLEDPPELIEKFIKKWEDGFSIVCAVKEKRYESKIKKCFFSLFYNLMERFSNISVDKQSGMFSLLDKKAAQELKKCKEKNKYYVGLRSFIGFRKTQIFYQREKRFAGHPKQTFRKLINYALDAFFSFSFFPIRVLTYFGFLILMIIFSASLVLVFNKVFKFHLFGFYDLPGWTSIVLLNFFILGIQIIFMGILGEYIARIFDEVKERPYYIIDEVYE